MKYPELQELGVEVLAASVDSHFSHRVWQETELSKMIEGGVPYPVLSDPGGAIGRAFGIYDDVALVDVRGRFIIDPDGIIQAMEVLTPPVGRNPLELIRQVQAYQYVRETGEVTPSGWHPGKPALSPSPALAGHVWEQWQVSSAFDGSAPAT